MLTAEIHQDLTRYRAKVAGGLTARTLACCAGALATGVAVGAYLTWVLGLPYDGVSILIYASTMPLWALGFWEPAGMRPERWLPLWLRSHVRPRLTYDTGARVARAAGQGHGDTTEGDGNAAIGRTSRAWKRFARRQRGVELWGPGEGL